MGRSRRKVRNHTLHQHRRTRPGSSPGVLTIDPESPQPVITVVAYGPAAYHEDAVRDLDPVRPMFEEWPVVWVNVDGLGNADVLYRIGQVFRLHPLALEDVVNLHQRAKVEHYGEQDYIVSHEVNLGEKFETEQISLFLGKNWVLTFQEQAGDSLDPVRERLRKNLGQIRASGPDFLAYAILDAIIDHYFPVLEVFGERLEALEARVLTNPDYEVMAEVHQLKRELLAFRRVLWPHRDALSTLLRDRGPLIRDETRLYFRDCYDHVVRIIDLLEIYRELGSDLVDLQLSLTSKRLNEVMQVLTVIATIFIPLTFITGLYGMNFDTQVSPWNMPELEWRYGYPYVLTLMALVAGTMLLYFRRKGWLGRRKPPRTGIRIEDAERPIR